MPSLRLRPRLAACALLAICAFTACSSSPPKPAGTAGEVRLANADAQALSELLEITRSGARRYRTDRGADLRETLQTWAKTSGVVLDWRVPAATAFTSTGAVDEYELKSAVVALATQWRSDDAALVLTFPEARLMRVATAVVKDGCPHIPAGAIVFGRYCVTPPPQWWLDPSDQLLSNALERWAKASGFELDWAAGADWPLRIKERKVYAGDLLQALPALLKDLQAQGAPLTFTVSGQTLAIESAAPAAAPATPATAPIAPTTKESSK